MEFGEPAQPLTAPAVRPRMSWRWKTTRRMAIGTAAMIVPAITRFKRSTSAWRRPLRPIWMVRWVSSAVVTFWGQRYWFQADRNENRARAPMAARPLRWRYVSGYPAEVAWLHG